MASRFHRSLPRRPAQAGPNPGIPSLSVLTTTVIGGESRSGDLREEDLRRRPSGRFDGAQFAVFSRENTPAIHENSIFSLCAAHDGSLWIGTEGGGLVRYRAGNFRSWSAKEGLTNGYVRAVAEDSQHDIWAGTDDGLFRVSNDAVVRVDGRDGVPFSSVHAIKEDRDGRLWVGGYHFFSLYGGKATEFPLPGGLFDNVKSIAQTRDGILWVGTVSGLERSLPSPDRKSVV